LGHGVDVLFTSAIACFCSTTDGFHPTVTGTPQGVIVALYLDRAQEPVYAGPNEYDYPRIGVLLAGQEMPAYGISEDENYVQIYYPVFQALSHGSMHLM